MIWSPYLLALQHKKYPRQLSDYKAYPLDFSSNDYLGLHHPSQKSFWQTLIQQAQLENIPMGATGARLLSGQHPIFMKVEEEIAHSLGQSVLLFNQGFSANMGILHALLEPEHTCVLMDKRNHASVYDGVHLSGKPCYRYRHLDMQHLEDQLKHLREKSQPHLKIWIVTETLFGMNGDFVRMPDLIDLARRYSTHLYLDEAHAIGVYGDDGYGCAHAYLKDLKEIGAVRVGTFGKALGLAGAFVACDDIIKNYLINFCRSFIYSTMMSPWQAWFIGQLWTMLSTPMMASKRAHLFILSQFFQQKWKEIKETKDAKEKKDTTQNNFTLPYERQGEGHIQLLQFNPQSTNQYPQDTSMHPLKTQQQIWQMQGIQTGYIQPPTTPKPCLKFNLCAHHTQQDIEKVFMSLYK